MYAKAMYLIYFVIEISSENEFIFNKLHFTITISLFAEEMKMNKWMVGK